MKQKTGKKGQAVNVLFTMLLFLVFVLCALFTVLIGGKVYENISARMEENYTGSTALNYVANKMRQGDMEGAVSVVDINGTSVLQLKQQFGEETYVTQIYYLNGSIRELFTDLQSGLSLEDGLEIMDSEGITFSQSGSRITAETAGEGGSRLVLSLRSGGQADEQ